MFHQVGIFQAQEEICKNGLLYLLRCNYSLVLFFFNFVFYYLLFIIMFHFYFCSSCFMVFFSAFFYRASKCQLKLPLAQLYFFINQLNICLFFLDCFTVVHISCMLFCIVSVLTGAWFGFIQDGTNGVWYFLHWTGQTGFRKHGGSTLRHRPHFLLE